MVSVRSGGASRRRRSRPRSRVPIFGDFFAAPDVEGLPKIVRPFSQHKKMLIVSLNHSGGKAFVQSCGGTVGKRMGLVSFEVEQVIAFLWLNSQGFR